MAVQDGYGKSSGSESLVFAYDLKDTVNSYKGEPTVNLTTDTPLLSGWQGTFTLVDTTSKTFIIETRQDNAATTSAWRTYYWNVSSYVGLFITISANVKFVSETNCNFRDFHIGQGNTGSFPLHIAGSSAQDKVSTSIKPVSKTFMTWSGVVNATGIVGFTQWIHNVTANGGNSFLEVSNIQIESKSHVTPFINGTRSATQGLLDLTGNSSIDLSNVSFDSNAQMTWDGTDDYVQGAASINYPTVWTDAYTLECMMYVPASATWFTTYVSSLIMKGSYAGSHGLVRSNVENTLAMWVRGDNGAIAASTTVSRDTWTHIVGVWTGEQVQIYKNGTLANTAGSARTGTPDGGGWRIGQSSAASGNVGNTYEGYLPIVKVYNRALTSTEVVNNYLKYKRQYGLT
jgi:hypothetical protein